MRCSIFKRCSAVLAACIVTGCSSWVSPSGVPTVSPPPASDTVPALPGGVTTTPELIAPVAVEILDELNDGEQLYLRAKIVAHTSWPTDRLELTLVNLEQGEERGRSSESLAHLISLGQAQGASSSQRLAAGDEVEVLLSVPHGGAHEYQLELRWGDGASGVAPCPLTLHLATLSIEALPCSQEPCLYRWVVQGEIFNPSLVPQRDIVLSAALRDPQAGPFASQNSIPQDGTPLPLAGLELGVGWSQEFRLSLEPALSRDLIQQVRPEVQVLSCRE